MLPTEFEPVSEPSQTHASDRAAKFLAYPSLIAFSKDFLENLNLDKEQQKFQERIFLFSQTG
jgi:hypothetical protein